MRAAIDEFARLWKTLSKGERKKLAPKIVKALLHLHAKQYGGQQ